MKVCRNCGARNDDSQNYCSNCGNPLNDSYNSGQNYAQNPSYGENSRGKNNTIPILIAIVVIVAIIVAGVVIVSLNKNKSQSANAVVSETVQTTTVQAVDETTQADESTTEAETTETQAQTTASVQKIYIYPGYMGGASEGYEYIPEDGYLFPSDSEYLTYDYLDSLTHDQISFIRNEIYARHGYIFKKSKFKDYFNSQSWYSGYESDMSVVEKSFNSVEKENIKTLVNYEKDMGWRD